MAIASLVGSQGQEEAPRLGPPGTSGKPASAEGLFSAAARPDHGRHPTDVERLLTQLDGLVESGNTVIMVEHEMRVVAGSDWVIDMGPGAGDEGGRVVVSGTPAEVARSPQSVTAPYLARFLG